MKVKQLLNTKFYKASALLGLSLFTINGAIAQTNVTIDTGDAWTSSMIVFANTPGQEYMFFSPGSEWPLEAIKTIVNTTDNTLTLYPNYSAYEAGNAYWSNGAMGNKIMLGLSYTEDDALVGQNFTFSGTCTSYTLNAAYTVKAFIKVMDASYANTIAEIVTPITATGNFTVAYNGTSLPAGTHIQYGFQTKGLNANPVNEAAYGNVVVTSGEPVIPVTPTGTEVTITTASPLIGYANWYMPDGTTYVGGEPIAAIGDLKTVLNGDNTIDLHPNFNRYASGDAAWINGDTGSRVYESNTYVQDDVLAGQTFTYSGHAISNSLASGYEVLAFIKIFDANYGNLQMTTKPLIVGEDFTISASPAAGSHVQYGYSVKGLNANPTQEAALGYARVGAATAAVKQFTKNNITLYPNPATNVLNITSQDAIDNVKIYNMLGQNVINITPKNTSTAIDVSSLTGGVYILNTIINGKETSARFVKQ